MKIYVVTGEDGEYSDWTTWIVKAFTDKAKAEAFELECEKFAKSFNKTMTAWRKINPYPSTGEYELWTERYEDFLSQLMSSAPDKDMPDGCYGGYDVKEVELE